MGSELTGVTAALRKRLSILPAAGRPLRLGMPETSRVAVAAALAAAHEAPTLLLVTNPSRSLATAEEASLYLEHVPVFRLPEREGLPYEFGRTDSAITIERARALGALGGSTRALVVASWAALSEHCAGPEVQREGIDLAVGGELDPTELLRELESTGYEVSYLADRPGTTARRGGIVDVFLPDGDQPLRIEFFGSQVESIRVVDLTTQRSVERLTSAHLPPAAGGGLAARSAAAYLARSLKPGGEPAEAIVEQFEILSDGGRSDLAASLEAVLFETTALAHLNGVALIVIEDEEDGVGALLRQSEYEERARDEQEQRGQIPVGLPALRLSPAAVREALSGHPLVHLERFGTEELGARRLPMAATPSFAGRLKPFAQQCGAWASAGKRVVVASQQALRLVEIMEEEGVHADLHRALPSDPAPGSLSLVPLALSGGFVFDDDLYVVSDAEIFGFRKRRRATRSRKSVRDDLVSTLEVGDYLVHADHGIARYGGLVRRTVEGVEREYLELQYAEGDRLYAPADQLDLVTRYVGPADHPPALTRLGSQDWARAKRRVKQAVIELAHELLQLYARREVAPGYAFPPDGAWQMEMEAAFPYVETPEQVEAITDVKADMERPRPMDRLICGDVGYGKTEVAIRAAFKAVADGKQVAILVPTTVLAEQHGSTFRERMAGFPVRIEVLSRFRSDAEQRAIVAAVTRGDADIVIGTHRLLQRDVAFKDLGLVIIDEEQRFGVSHKERLKQMRAEVDTLTLSATPIPRTLQMSLHGIRDMSTIMTPPEERLPVRTYVMGWDDEILREAIDREMQRGGQVYFVHNRVHNIERIMTRLREIVPEANITIGHGQMHEDQLERVMMEFGAGDHDILICTTIIESGLDIPNANTIIINNADQLGLAQLYQLRGRVGRGANQAYAYLLHDKDRTMSEHAGKRLEAIFEATELGAGFQIALRDLEIRGAGNVLGNEQSGHIAAVGFDMYSKLVAEAVGALKATQPGGDGKLPPSTPTPSVDLPISAHIPQNYIEDIHDRLAVYQRIAGIDTAERVAEMQAELRDRFGPVPPAVDNLLYVALVKSVAKRARVESIKTDEQMFHLRVRDGVPPGMREAVTALGMKGVMIGPNQVRLDRVAHAKDWMTVIVRVLRTMAGAAA